MTASSYEPFTNAPETAMPKSWPPKKVTLTKATLFSLGIVAGFVAGWLFGRYSAGLSLKPTPSPAPIEVLPQDSPMPIIITPPEQTEPDFPPGGGMVACTMEAKICPDGSSVGRQGPNCEFAPCPGEGAGGSGVSSSGETVVLPAAPAVLLAPGEPMTTPAQPPTISP